MGRHGCWTTEIQSRQKTGKMQSGQRRQRRTRAKGCPKPHCIQVSVVVDPHPPRVSSVPGPGGTEHSRPARARSARGQGCRTSQPAFTHPLQLVGVKRYNWEHSQNEVSGEGKFLRRGRESGQTCVHENESSKHTKSQLASTGLHGASDLTEPFSPVMWSSLTRQLCAAGFLHQLHEEEFPFPRPERGGCGIFWPENPKSA